ncbi:MAG: tRNA preQ1(34) S-adenosylmethionine ribosyltransferase-isomerase QueA, partial [Chloroflexi bacterium]|nr:tRNA preQ1(34) S-adenosylmethionine ribosyltransferase-isomerase QueA [Chloroflexota bacterium]
MDLRTSDFDYHLPSDLIAQTPIEPRDASRLMVVAKSEGQVSHRQFFDLPDLLREGDVLVFNDSRVIPARLFGHRDGPGGKIELLLLDRISTGVWRALVKPGRRMTVGAGFTVTNQEGEPVMSGKVLEVEEAGTRIVEFSDDEGFRAAGVIPLPPYIHEKLDDPERYQTVYSKREGSVAAPTAGLHFTPELLTEIRSRGVETAFVTLHVGWDTFRPINTEDATSHEMHSEAWELSPDAAEAINQAKLEGRRVISVGTTAVRLLEHSALANTSVDRVLTSGAGRADLFIYPGFEFKV